MPQYIYRQYLPGGRKPSDMTPAEREIAGRHFAYLQEITRRGIAILVGRTKNDDPTTFGIVIFEAESDEAARAVMNDDPAVAEGLLQAELFPFEVQLQREPAQR